VFRLNENEQKTSRNSLTEIICWYFSENLGFFRFVLICFETVLFVSVVFRYRFETTKQTKFFLVPETNRDTTETDLVSVCLVQF
jgi:hypothetical protein